MRIGIVGSRTFPNIDVMPEYFRHFQRHDVIVSGCAEHPTDDHNKNNVIDIRARELAAEFKLTFVGFPPDLSRLPQEARRWHYAQAFHKRNTQLANYLAEGKRNGEGAKLLAFVDKDKGGTWDTIKKCRMAHRKIHVDIVRPLEKPVRQFERPGRPAKSIYHLKQVNFGSIALHLQRHFSTIEWADYINLKDAQPFDCALFMQPDFLHFFQTYGPSLGHIDAITQAPRSLRHLDKPHCMDYLCKSISGHTGLPYVEMFAPWDKPRRGMHEHPDIDPLPVIQDYAGKVIYVLDDVSTTGITLKKCIEALHQHDAHAHGLCFVRWA